MLIAANKPIMLHVVVLKAVFLLCVVAPIVFTIKTLQIRDVQIM
jgi:hypothetical protein